VVLTIAVGASAEPPEEWKQIEAAIRQRREQCGVFSCRVEEFRSTPLSFYFPGPDKPDLDDPLITEANYNYTIDVAAVRFRNEENSPDFAES